jgi:predicted dehydrogenase
MQSFWKRKNLRRKFLVENIFKKSLTTARNHDTRYAHETRTKKFFQCGGSALDQPIKVGIIGCGNVTLGYHVPALLALKDVAISGIADPNEMRRTRVQQAAQLPDAYSFSDHRALLDTKPDYVLLAVPPKFRHAILHDCAAARVHVLSEKPLAIVPREAQAMIDLMQRAQLQFGMVHNYLFFPEYQLARQLAADGSIGQLRHVTLNFLGMPDNPGAAEFRPHWRHDVAEAGGGILMDMLHVMYVAEYFFQQPLRAVSAVIDNLDHAGDAVEDFCLIHLHFDSGYATINLAWGEGMGGAEIGGTDGRIMIFYEQYGTGPFLPLLNFTLKNRDGIQQFEPRQDTNLRANFQLLHAQFADAVRNHHAPIAPADAGLRALQAVLAAYKSAALGAVIPLPFATDDPVFQRGVLGLREYTLPSHSPLARRGLFGLHA